MKKFLYALIPLFLLTLILPFLHSDLTTSAQTTTVDPTTTVPTTTPTLDPTSAFLASIPPPPPGLPPGINFFAGRPTPDVANWPPAGEGGRVGGCRKAYYSLEIYCPEKTPPYCFKQYRQSLVSPKNDICPDIKRCYNFNDARADKDNNIWCPPDAPSPTPAPAPCAERDAKGACTSVTTSLYDTPIKTEAGEFIQVISLIVLSLAGGIAVLLLISAGYKILTSSGKPEAIQAGREQLTSAIVGLLFIIFSYVIFQFIVSDLLKIPGITN